jgi:predicted phosphoribosyltransferase
MQRFRNRRVAGQKLGEKLAAYRDREDAIVLGLARGGLPVAFEVAKSLGVPMDVFLVRKLGVPGREELAMGAIASGGIRVVNDDVVRSLGVSDEDIEEVAEREQKELQRREEAYRGDRPSPRLEGRTVILVDDGMATGASMKSAVEAVKEAGPKAVVVAIPTAAPQTVEAISEHVDDVVCLITPQPFMAVGTWYDDFSQTTDEEVKDYLDRAADELPAP